MKKTTIVKAINRGLAACIMMFAQLHFPATAAEDLKAQIERGRAIAKQNCARCHSITRSGPSALAKAPPFRELSKRYPVRELEEPLAEGIVTAHKEMPVFRFDPPDIGALLSFMEDLGSS